MIHPGSELRFVNNQIGYGVFATQDLPTGTIVYVQDRLDISIPPESPLLRDPSYRETLDKYTFEDASGNRVLSWDHAKYVNHCCQCNTMSTGYGFEVAIRDIHVGEEITDEYGLFWFGEGIKLICPQENCRGCLRPDDIDTYGRRWDERVKGALRHVPEVPQPLMHLIDEHTHRALVRYLETGRGYRSVMTLKYGVRGRMRAGASRG